MKLPHSLRVIILLLRVALGLNFFYLGFSVLFNPALGKTVSARSFGNLYSWLATPAAVAGQGNWIQAVAQWAFLIIGICLILGLLTRLASIVGIVLALFSYLPTVSFAAFNVAQFINDEVIIVICLLILIFSNAGNYLGLDTFIHFHRPKKT
ncbi:MAG: DoxX family protein [Minisyncoccia bacterium]|jgi:thiosulfate dehydrogenase [quinone] large subunit